MRRVRIQTTQEEYSAGEMVEGDLVIECDRPFDCKAVHITLTGREHTRVFVRTNSGSVTRREEYVYIKNRQELCGSAKISAGETAFPFRFSLPSDIPPSYSGYNGWVEYTLSGVVEVPLSIDPKNRVNITVSSPSSPPENGSVQRTLCIDNTPALDIELEEAHVSLGSPIRFGIRAAYNVDLSGISAELIVVESVVAKRHKSRLMKYLGKWSISGDELVRGTWLYGLIDTNNSMPLSIQLRLIKNEAFLKVTLGRRWRLDPCVKIPVVLVRASHRTDADLL